MHYRKTKTLDFNAILPYCQEQKSLLTRIALISRSFSILPKFAELTLIVLEYLQLISLDIFLNASIHQPLTQSSSELYTTFLVFARIIGPGYFLQLDGDDAIVLIIISAIMSLICVIKYALLFYVIVIAAMKSNGNHGLIKLWCFIFHTQSRVGYYVATSFWTNILSAIFRDEPIITDNEKLYITIWSIVMIILEFALAFGIEVLFPYCLPTKSMLASKNPTVKVITLVQKLFMQIINLSQVPQTLGMAWTINSINLVINTLKKGIFFRTLPFYKYKPLMCQLMLSITMENLDIAYFFYTLLRTSYGEDTEINQNFFIFTWIILTVLRSIFALTAARKVIFNLVMKWEENTPEVMLHKILFIKKLLKESHAPTKFVSKYNLNQLLMASLTVNLNAVLNLSPDIKLDLDSKQGINSLVSLYLDKLCQIRPRSSFVKLYRAYHYGKKLKLYGYGMNVLVNLRRTFPSRATEMSISLLIHEMEHVLIADYNAKNEKIDLYLFTQTQKRVTELKENMVHQADLQAKICQEMNKNNASLAKVYNYSLKVVDCRAKINRKYKSVLAAIPDYHIEPLALCAHYQLVLNHSMETYLKLYKEYNMKQQKYKYSFQIDGHDQENTYQRGNIFFVLSGKKESVGTVLYCNREATELYGRDIKGEKGWALTTPSTHKHFQVALQATLERGDMFLMGKTVRAFQYNQAGYVTLGDFYMNISPVLSRDLYYFAIIRKVSTSKEFILLNEDGTIEAATKNISYELGLLSPQISGTRNLFQVSQISSKLALANKAFNMIAFPEKYQSERDLAKRVVSIKLEGEDVVQIDLDRKGKSHNVSSKGFLHKEDVAMSVDQANKIYSVYSTEGKNLALRGINTSTAYPALYNCRIENQIFNSLLLKVISVEKVGADKDEEDKKNEKTPQYTPMEPRTPQQQRQNSKAKIEIIKHSETELSDEEEISHIVNENEKEEGWIDLKRLKSSSKYELVSPVMSNIPLINFDAQNDKSSPVKRSRTVSLMKSRAKPSSPTQAGQEGTSGDKQVEIERLDLADRNSKTTHTSGAVVQLKISKMFHEAIRLKHYSKSYRVFLGLWYCLLLAILITQLQLNLSGQSHLRDFQARKNVLINSNSLSNVLPVIHMHTRTLWLITKYTGPPYDLPLSQEDIIGVAFEDFDEIRAINYALMEASTQINKENRQILFEKDIRMFEANSSAYINLTNFQAVGRLIETGYNSLNMGSSNLEDAIPGFEIVLRNDLDDLLVQSDSVSKVILDYTKENNQEAIRELNVSLGLTIGGIAIMIIFFIVLVHYQYKKDINNTAAMLKMNKNGVGIMLNRVLNFKKTIESCHDFEEIQAADVMKYYFRDYHRSNLQAKGEKNREIQNLDYKRVGIRFWIYLLQTLILLGLITIVIGINQMNSKNSLTDKEYRLNQLTFMINLKKSGSLTYATILDILIDPNIGTIVKNNNISFELSKQLTKFSNYISLVPDQLKDKNSEYDPQIKTILFDDLCHNLYDDSFERCVEGRQGTTKGLLQGLSEAELFARNMIAQPISINPEQCMELFVIKNFVLRSIIDNILDILNSSFDDVIEKDISLDGALNGVVTASLVIMCIGVHILVLRKVGESDNDFKKILETFPAPLVFSNFMLKAFIMKTSRGILDPVKDEL